MYLNLIFLAIIIFLATYKQEVISEIKYFNRKTKIMEIEKVPGEFWLKWLYYNPLGKLTTSTLIKNKFVSEYMGRRMDNPKSKYKVPGFIDKFDINLDESVKQEFNSFNDFFIRELKVEARPIDKNTNSIVSPADGKILYFEDLSKVDNFFVKGSKFDLSNFLNNSKWVEEFKDGSMAIIRLAPADYHRFHFPANAKLIEKNKLEGAYYSVSPYAVKGNIDYYVKNKREHTYLENENIGDFIMTEVGATMVGSIIQTYNEDSLLKKGQEKGYFKFGGSTVILLFKKDKVKFDKDIIENSKNAIETKIFMGEKIAEF